MATCIASFGTWRDAYGRLVWGIDDFDEAYPMGYANDLDRLGVSAIMDEQEGALAVGVRDICNVLFDGYREGLAAEEGLSCWRNGTSGCGKSR